MDSCRVRRRGKVGTAVGFERSRIGRQTGLVLGDGEGRSECLSRKRTVRRVSSAEVL